MDKTKQAQQEFVDEIERESAENIEGLRHKLAEMEEMLREGREILTPAKQKELWEGLYILGNELEEMQTEWAARFAGLRQKMGANNDG